MPASYPSFCRLCAALKPAFGEHAPPMERMAGSDLREMLQLPGLAAHPAVARALAASLDAGPAWPQVPPGCTPCRVLDIPCCTDCDKYCVELPGPGVLYPVLLYHHARLQLSWRSAHGAAAEMELWSLLSVLALTPPHLISSSLMLRTLDPMQAPPRIPEGEPLDFELPQDVSRTLLAPTSHS